MSAESEFVCSRCFKEWCGIEADTLCPVCRLKDAKLVGRRLEIRFDGELILGASLSDEIQKPNNHEEMVALLEQLLDWMKAPVVEGQDPL